MRGYFRGLLFLMTLMLTAALCQGDDEPKTDSRGGAIAVLRTSGLADDLYNGVIEYVAAQYETEVREGKIEGPLPRERKALGDLVVTRLGENDVCLLVLLAGPRGAAGGQEITLLQSKRTIVLDTTVLDPGEGETEGRRKLHRLRVQKEALRAIALVLGVPACPSVRCALLRHRNDARLDVKSLNPCPPCLSKIQKKLREAGVALPVVIR